MFIVDLNEVYNLRSQYIKQKYNFKCDHIFFKPQNEEEETEDYIIKKNNLFRICISLNYFW